MAKAAYPLQLAIAGLAYFAAGWLSLNAFALINSSASPVWPSTGIAIAASMLGGYRLWPAFLIGAFFIQFYGEWSCAVKRCYSCWKYARGPGWLLVGKPNSAAGGRLSIMPQAPSRLVHCWQ